MAYQTIHSADGAKSQLYTVEQFIIVHLIAARLLGKHSLVNKLYLKLRDGIRQSQNSKMKVAVVSIVLLPLNYKLM